MEGFWTLAALFGGIVIMNRGLRMYFSMKHPQILGAWDEQEERRAERRKKLAVGAAKGGFALFRLLKK